MRYHSTRGASAPVPAVQALLSGAAKDGGLFVPESLPSRQAIGPLGPGYGDVAVRMLAAFFPEVVTEQVAAQLQAAYARFDAAGVTPLVPVGGSFVLELFHGPTAAFKDLALQALPLLLARARELASPDLRYAVLTATSGDTGSAAMEGFRDIPGFSVLVYYPMKGISPMQQAQMTRMPGDNLKAVGIRGNFDDAQAAVKDAFQQQEALLPPGMALTSANSINIGRLVPQMVYYITACRELTQKHGVQPGQDIDFIVPTGNFGDILAGYLVKRLGWPIGRLVCASNENRVLTDFLATGRYDKNRALRTSLSPAMDILVSSNLERLLYYAFLEDTHKVQALMADLARDGHYQVSGPALSHIQEHFQGASATDGDTLTAIRQVFGEYRYLMDPHTATAWLAQEALGPSRNPRVVLATASPFKFPKTVLAAINKPVPKDPAQLLPSLEAAAGQPVPRALAAVLTRPVRHRDLVDREDILQDITWRLAAW
ncbi:MAG: threonine synthase [Clostridiales bacterium]|nr:threonine synthase [Clostridiales bacterium]